MTAALSRRHLVGAGSVAGFATMAVTGVSRRANGVPTPPPSDDAALLAACANFELAHTDQARMSTDYEMPDEQCDVIEDNWDHAINALLTAPAPQTELGRITLAKAARSAFIDKVSLGLPHQFGEYATLEDRLVLLSLVAVGGA